MTDFKSLVNIFIDLLLLVVPLIFAITLVFIIWRIIDAWIINVGVETKLEAGKQTAFAGVIALVVMSGLWGILQVLRNSLF